MKRYYILLDAETKKYLNSKYWDDVFTLDVKDARLFSSISNLESFLKFEDMDTLKHELENVEVWEAKAIYVLEF